MNLEVRRGRKKGRKFEKNFAANEVVLVRIA